MAHSRMDQVQMIPRILIVEDDPAIRALIAAALKREALLVDGAADGAAALEMMRVARYSVIVLDLMMPRMNGAQFLAAYPEVTDARPVVLVVTAYDDMTAKKQVEGRAHAILRKPFDVDRLVEIVRDSALAHVAATSTPDDRLGDAPTDADAAPN